jgi:hypothetical protein
LKKYRQISKDPAQAAVFQAPQASDGWREEFTDKEKERGGGGGGDGRTGGRRREGGLEERYDATEQK